MKQLEVINFESFAKVYPAYNELFHNYKEKHVAQNMQLIEMTRRLTSLVERFSKVSHIL